MKIKQSLTNFTLIYKNYLKKNKLMNNVLKDFEPKCFRTPVAYILPKTH